MFLFELAVYSGNQSLNINLINQIFSNNDNNKIIIQFLKTLFSRQRRESTYFPDATHLGKTRFLATGGEK